MIMANYGILNAIFGSNGLASKLVYLVWSPRTDARP